ncbi:hypothetical protein PspLS_05561 [Pyricularia sp. CBS 133598]|nr:hypothetical protein PspLS_05561 [Pyricularia sp. CBS 133598]
MKPGHNRQTPHCLVLPTGSPYKSDPGVAPDFVSPTYSNPSAHPFYLPPTTMVQIITCQASGLVRGKYLHWQPRKHTLPVETSTRLQHFGCSNWFICPCNPCFFPLDWAPKGWSKMAPLRGFFVVFFLSISVVINTTLHPSLESMIAVFKVTLDPSFVRCAADENRAARCTGAGRRGFE